MKGNISKMLAAAARLVWVGILLVAVLNANAQADPTQVRKENFKGVLI